MKTTRERMKEVMEEEGRWSNLIQPIDVDALDEEWKQQPNLYMKYVEEAKRLQKEARLAEELVKTIRSELILEANRDGIPGVDKITDTKVEAFYRTHPKYQEAKAAWIQAQYESDVADGKVWAAQQRKSALENLALLWGQEYFSSPREPRKTPATSRMGDGWGPRMREAADARKKRETTNEED